MGGREQTENSGRTKGRGNGGKTRRGGHGNDGWLVPSPKRISWILVSSQSDRFRRQREAVRDVDFTPLPKGGGSAFLTR